MTSGAVRGVDAEDLRKAGRLPATPFCVMLADGRAIAVHRLLRVLPGKRIVGEGVWDGRRVLVKLFVAGGSERHWAQEKTGIAALQQAGLLTPDLLLAAPLAQGGHVLLTAFLDGSLTLAEAWESLAALPAGSSAALDVLRPAFRLLGKLHASGLVQEDLHLGNFLRHGDLVLIIDGDAVRAITPGKRLNEAQASANLAILLAQLPAAWDACRDELLAAYQAGGGERISDLGALEGELARVRRWRLNDYLAKTVRDCTLFAVRSDFSRFAVVQRKVADQLAPLLETPDAAMLQGRLLKDGRTSTVARVEQPGCLLVIKRYNLKNLQHALERFWRPSRAWHSWREGHRLSFLGIPTPEPLAMIEERIGPFRRRAFLVNAYCPGPHLLQALTPDKPPASEMAQAISSLFQALYHNRISHGDLKATNLLWHEGRVWLVDLDAVVQHRSESGFEPAWRRDRARFLRNWPAESALHQWLDDKLPPAERSVHDRRRSSP